MTLQVHLWVQVLLLFLQLNANVDKNAFCEKILVIGILLCFLNWTIAHMLSIIDMSNIFTLSS